MHTLTLGMISLIWCVHIFFFFLLHTSFDNSLVYRHYSRESIHKTVSSTLHSYSYSCSYSCSNSSCQQYIQLQSTNTLLYISRVQSTYTILYCLVRVRIVRTILHSKTSYSHSHHLNARTQILYMSSPDYTIQYYSTTYCPYSTYNLRCAHHTRQTNDLVSLHKFP